MTTGALRVPGAVLHHERRGAGPVLLMIPGGAADAGLYAGMADALAARRTVVTYDPRGLSRSPLDGPAGDQRPEVWADDARRLLDLHAPEGGASVFGSSSGAIVALHLLARRPDGVRRVVAHEPPLLELLHDPAPHRALFAAVRDAYIADGVAAATALFAEGLGGGDGGDGGRDAPADVPPEIREMAPRMAANMPVFLERMLVPFSSSVPDLDALGAVADRLVPAAGRDSRGVTPLYGPVARLAELLDRDVVEFPGGHLGAVERPREFGERLLLTLG
ncbi:alpha/beta hydrolase [Actinomadura sp. PM05-2]|uniref:Alpha/beta hydrolase n=1 Tax=Actinomadura parmotrematis TaxID=2864039 RepID=A0ABS7FWM3_9ACTN|nr:alpha/beta hydrolase [Actinomadura parmotrematis]